ncbi:hypothetical protein LJB98_00810 [Bacteroidales bacterium OttesenSCG-928-M11]|nr:hypothetical protein [Bacteroidales bacterium OttesenSCG-928-M11]
MKNITKIIGSVILIFGLLFSACSDMLDTDSDRFLLTDDNKLDSPNDSIYSVLGILEKLQYLGDRHVILGELRGELMDVTDNADENLRAIRNFTATADNPYASKRDYYALINNCNYYINYVDTSIVSGGIKVLLKEYAAIKAIRAWSYMQLVLNFGEATYIEKPIFSNEDLEKTYPVLNIDEMCNALIKDLLPYEDVDMLNYGEISGRETNYCFFPIPFLLGDLYMWQGNYALAAEKYYKLIEKNGYYISSSRYTNQWLSSDFSAVSNRWSDMFPAYSGEIITTIPYVLSANNNFETFSLTAPSASVAENYQYKLAPSQAAMDMWANEPYYYYNKTSNVSADGFGDLRGKSLFGSASGSGGSYAIQTISDADSVPFITKYTFSSDLPSAWIYRVGLLYLRYAEAVNQAGYPSLAFAVLKYGTHPLTLSDPTKVKLEEITPRPAFATFSFLSTMFENSSSIGGIHARGCGNVEADTVTYIFPKDEYMLATKQDSIDFVDAKICLELGLETAFEGNRFHDLMRFSLRKDDPVAYMQEWIGKKDPAVAATLNSKEKWFLPSK